MTKLKPCPFCGGKPTLVDQSIVDENGLKFVLCNECVCCMYYDVWNTRPIEDFLSKMLKGENERADMLFKKYQEFVSLAGKEMDKDD